MKASLRGGLLAAVAASGAAGLIWEILWQHHGALAFGVSAKSAAITLTSAMAGFAIGGLLVSRLACRRRLPDPLTAYAIAEVAIAAFGVALPYVLALLARLDAAVWARTPTLANPVQVLGTLLVLLGPAIAMGATVPILGSAVEASRTSLGIVYAVNTLGATAGIVLATFVALPTLGVRGTGLLAAGLNLAAALWAVKAARHRSPAPVA